MTLQPLEYLPRTTHDYLRQKYKVWQDGLTTRRKVIEAILAEARNNITSTKQDVCFFRDMKPPVHSMRVRECKNPMFLIVK